MTALDVLLARAANRIEDIVPPPDRTPQIVELINDLRLGAKRAAEICRIVNATQSQKPTEWTPTAHLRARSDFRGHILEQLWVCRDQQEWRSLPKVNADGTPVVEEPNLRALRKEKHQEQ